METNYETRLNSFKEYMDYCNTPKDYTPSEVIEGRKRLHEVFDGPVITETEKKLQVKETLSYEERLKEIEYEDMLLCV